MRVTFDTNILIYAYNRADRLHAAAVGLVRRAADADCVQPMQTFGEFFHVATRKYRRPPAEAAAAIGAFRAIVETTAADLSDLEEAMRVAPAYRLQFWDALIWAAARRAGSRILFTEDMNDGQDVEGVRIVNPFAEANRPIVDLALPPSPAEP